MRRIGSLIHESIEERKNVTLEEYKKAGVLPSIAASCDDGILLVGVSNRPGVSKIWRILDRSAFLGVGNTSKYEELYDAISISAKVQAVMERSVGDSIVMENIIRASSSTVRSAFRDLLTNDYFECDIVIARLGFDQEDDDLCLINFTGLRTHSKSFVCVPDIIWTDWIKSVSNKTMREAFVDIWRKLEEKRVELKQEKFFFEVAILSREEALAKNFGRIYQKLHQKKITEWISILAQGV